MMENHTKYIREIIPDIEESLSKIVGKIDQNSVVLDVGCSSGMLGRYLVLNKACVVDGIDIDASAVTVCHPDYRKVVVRNLESDRILQDFLPASYDYIIVADVIEHLIQPRALLEQLRMLVKPHGQIIFSVPNITHIASSLELLTGRLNYSQNGLLDSTHLRFYSYQGLIETLAASGIHVCHLDSVQRALNETEFADTHTRLFPKKWLDTVIESRPDALVYQWILSTRIYPDSRTIDESLRWEKEVADPIFTTALYWSGNGNGEFNDSNKLFGYKKQSAPNEFLVEFRFENRETESIQRIRIDPVSEKKSIWIKRAYILNENKLICWQWAGSRTTDDVGNGRWADLAPEQGLILIATDDDPQWYPAIPPKVLSRLCNGAKFVFVLSDDSALIDAQIEAGWQKKKVALDLYADMTQKQTERIAQLASENDQKDRVLSEVKNYIDQQEKAIADLQQALSLQTHHIDQQNTTIADLQQALNLQSRHIDEILHSASWRLTKPLRYLRRKLRSVAGVRSAPVGIGPVTPDRTVSAEISISAPHDDALSQEAQIESPLAGASTQPGETKKAATDGLIIYAPLLKAEPLETKQAKLICFYLPQFHAIPENDAWWGKGFTEWTNVEPAQAQFVGHYQPHIPGELGYYNLLDTAVQKRQVELARLYGIEGFCFYFYWFGGKRLLEQPVLNYLRSPELDLPFCLCWANENWTRRWDGLERDVLIAQNYSEEDDLAFIEYVAQYMQDPRYIRIFGRPLLLVYRPELFPNPKHTANRWRNWCRENGIGEIYLAYTQSFETVDPQNYDFDAAVEFPPNNAAPPDVTKEVVPLTENFNGKVYDASVFETRSKDYALPHYRLFRSVFPSWDNTARRKNNASILLNTNPASYQRWLQNAVTDTVKNNSSDERLVFINAWNEWAEGAHLEPDQRHGYAYLEATRLALLKNSIEERKIDLIEAQKVLAVIIHAFYVDVFDEILDRLDAIAQVRIKLYVTTTAENELVIRARLKARQHDFVVLVVENRGRDILPFMKIITQVRRAGHKLFVKVHTKKSLHRVDGDDWRGDLFQKLLSDEAILRGIATFAQDSSIGIIGPAGHLASMTHYFGSNHRRVNELASRLGVDTNSLSGFEFVAGSMFLARMDALLPLLNLAIDDAEYETEAGQVDATLAHAIERIFSVSAYSANLRTISFSE